MSNNNAVHCTADGCALPSSTSVNSNTQSSLPSSSSSSGGRVVPITIVSDTVCPWCFVGKRRLEKALKRFPNTEFQITWKPFFLNPDAPYPSVNKLEAYKAKFGAQRVAQMLPFMKETGKQEGINFSYGGNTGRTMDSHRLIEYALLKGGETKQNELVEKLFSYYFEQERDIVDVNTLVEAASSVGLNGSDVRRMLESDELKKDVTKNVNDNYARQISGVPHFTFDGKFSVSGGQDPEVFVDILKQRVGLTPQ